MPARKNGDGGPFPSPEKLGRWERIVKQKLEGEGTVPNWTIKQYDSDACVDERQKAATESGIRDLLRQLAATHLTARELRESGERLLNVQESRPDDKLLLACGENSFYR